MITLWLTSVSQSKCLQSNCIAIQPATVLIKHEGMQWVYLMHGSYMQVCCSADDLMYVHDSKP